MGLVFYNISLWFYRMVIRLAAPFHHKASEFTRGRKGLLKKIKNEVRGEHIWWFHCASLGEFEQGRPVIEQLKKELPGIQILVTFYSPSGYEAQKHYPGGEYVFYLPLDSKSNARLFLDIVKPEAAVFVKYEFWFHYFNELASRNIPLVLISSIFRPGQPFFRSFGSLHRKMLKYITKIFTQDKESVRMLQEIGIEHATHAGDTRFDRVWQIRANAEDISGIADFKKDNRVLVIGSCWKEDLELLIPYINNSPEGIRYIIAPHVITESNLRMLEKQIRLRTIRYSEYGEHELGEVRVVIIDSIGLLSRLYKHGEFAFVGGAFGDGLHNILEPAAFGLPVFFGNKSFNKFREARDLLEIGGAWVVKDFYEFEQKFNPLLDESTRRVVSEIVSSYTQSNIGATDKIIAYLKTRAT